MHERTNGNAARWLGMILSFLFALSVGAYGFAYAQREAVEARLMRIEAKLDQLLFQDRPRSERWR